MILLNVNRMCIYAHKLGIRTRSIYNIQETDLTRRHTMRIETMLGSDVTQYDMIMLIWTSMVIRGTTNHHEKTGWFVIIRHH